ncbi:phospholipase domain-containing protein [Nocardioides conyzicola]|uniref:Bacterial phospholipase C C-terminal domain-containing protein n=1 Tax=Nocardioides conyzicola TaxID=1651781 RepID=A0ABP8Y018_9ACTN
MADLKDIEHLLIVIAEDVPVASVTALPELVTTCRNYHLTPDGEERAERVWPSFAVLLRDAGVTVHLRASMPDTLGDVTVIEGSAATVEAVLAGLGDLPPATLVAVALGGGDALPVAESWGPALGAPGTLLLHTPWTSRAWVSDEVCDHTSLIQLCERWTASHGHEARIWLTEWRRRVCGDLVGAVDLGEPVESTDTDGVPARPLPYAPSAEIGTRAGAAVLELTNAGASLGIHLRVEDGGRTTGVTVPASPAARPRTITVPVTTRDGRYDVTVTGPGGFARHLTGELTTSRALEGRLG